jgi:hypothetical protein
MMFGRRNVGVSATHSASKTVSTLEQLSDAQLLCRAARQVLKVRCMVSKIMLVKPTLAVTRPAETRRLVRALAQCLRAATAVLTETTQPTANPGK